MAAYVRVRGAMMIPTLLFLLHVISAAKAQQSCSSTVDLSPTYFDEADDYNANQDSAKLLDLVQSDATGNDQVYSYVVLENGQKIAEYYNDFLNATVDTTHDVYSITKSWTGLLFGIMLDQGHISLDQKVGDIWSYPDHEVWSSVDNDPEVKDIMVDQLLSMTSGFDDGSMNEIDFANVGGADLAGVLNYVVHTGQQNEGKFNYLGFANILGYIVQEVTGKTPVEYAQEHIFPLLGMEEGTYDWASNTDQVSYTRNGLSLTATHMTKWAQLYLQNGQASPSSEMVSKEWIDTSKAKNVQVTDINTYVYQAMLGGTPDNGSDLFYGKMLWNFVDGKHCGFGAGGSFMCFWPEKCRAAAIQMNLFSEAGTASNGILAHKFLSLVGGKDFSEADYTIDASSNEPAAEEDAPTSGAKDDKNDHIRTGLMAFSIATTALFL